MFCIQACLKKNRVDLFVFEGVHEMEKYNEVCANYTHLSQGHPKWRFSTGIPSQMLLRSGLGFLFSNLPSPIKSKNCMLFGKFFGCLWIFGFPCFQPFGRIRSYTVVERGSQVRGSTFGAGSDTSVFWRVGC